MRADVDLVVDSRKRSGLGSETEPDIPRKDISMVTFIAGIAIGLLAFGYLIVVRPNVNH